MLPCAEDLLFKFQSLLYLKETMQTQLLDVIGGLDMNV